MEDVQEAYEGRTGFFLSLVPWVTLLITQITRPG